MDIATMFPVGCKVKVAIKLPDMKPAWVDWQMDKTLGHVGQVVETKIYNLADMTSIAALGGLIATLKK